jgi:hypothetical protein
MDLCKNDPAVDNYHLLGHWKAKPLKIRYAAIIAWVCGSITDPSASILLNDDRFLKHAGLLWQTLLNELKILASIPDVTWSWLAEVVGVDCNPRELRSDCILACLGAIAYIYRGAFHCLKELPLSLTQGVLVDNLHGLMATNLSALDGVDFARNMRLALESGMSMSAAEDVLKLANDGPGVSDLVERAHGAGAKVMQHHWAYSEPQLQARNLITSAQGIFSESTVDAQIRKLDARIDALHAKQERRSFGGRQLLLERMYEQELIIIQAFYQNSYSII